MALNDTDRVLIDRYLDGQLSGKELGDFLERLDQDHAFQQDVSFYNLLSEGIREASDTKLKFEITRFINYRKPKIPLGLKLIFTFILITVIGIALWNYTGVDNDESSKRKSVFSFFRNSDDRKKESPSNSSKGKPSETKSRSTSHNESAKPVKAGKENSNHTNAKEAKVETAGNDSFNNTVNQSRDLNIKKDQLLVSHKLTVDVRKPISESKVQEKEGTSLSKTTAEKLNPEASLQETENSPESYEVEFWVSPVNYKGYRMGKNKIILFGIEEPDAVQLLKAENQLYMKYGKEYFRLSEADEYSGFQRVPETELTFLSKR